MRGSGAKEDMRNDLGSQSHPRSFHVRSPSAPHPASIDAARIGRIVEVVIFQIGAHTAHWMLHHPRLPDLNEVVESDL